MSVPTADNVADLLLRLSHSRWPTSDAERVTWSTHFGLPSTGDEELWSTATTQAFSAPAAINWPQREFGWHTYRGAFVGVRWFLWDDLPRDEVRTRAIQLKALLDHHLGPAADETLEDPATHLGFNALWKRFDRTVLMYFFTGIHTQRSGQREHGPAVVQLHLDHTERSDAQEVHAQRNPSGRPSTPA